VATTTTTKAKTYPWGKKAYNAVAGPGFDLRGGA